MRIKFKKRRLYLNFVFGSLWILIGVYEFYRVEGVNGLGYAYCILGALYIGQFLNEIINPYLKIENGVMKMNFFHGNGKSIPLDDIERIKKSSNDYILFFNNNEARVEARLIDNESIEKLENVLRELNLPLDKTPFLKRTKRKP